MVGELIARTAALQRADLAGEIVQRVEFLACLAFRPGAGQQAGGGGADQAILLEDSAVLGQLIRGDRFRVEALELRLQLVLLHLGGVEGGRIPRDVVEHLLVLDFLHIGALRIGGLALKDPGAERRGPGDY